MAEDLTDYNGPLAMAGSADDDSALSLVPMSAPLRAMFERGQKMANVDFSEADRRREEAIANKRAAIQRGYQNLLSSKPDNIELLLSISKGLLSPTRTGAFAEGLGNVAGEALPALQRQRQMERNRQDQLAQYDVSMSSVDAEASKDLYDKLLRRAQIGQQTMNRASTLAAQEDLQRDRLALTREMALMRADQARANAQTAAASRRELRDIELDDDEAKSFGLPRGGTYTVSVDKANPEDVRIVGRVKPQNTGGTVQDIMLTEEQAAKFGVPPGPAKVRVDAQGNIVSVIGRPLTVEEKKGEPSASLSLDERKAVAERLGVPLQDVDPTAGMSKGAADAVIKEQNKQAEKLLAEMREAVATGRASLADYKRFEQLLQKQGTGGVYGAPVIGGAARAISGMTNAELREMQSIADRITPTMRQPGSGATSDFDARMFQSATVGVDKPAATNRAIIRGAQAAQQNLIDRLAFFEAYATANRGSLRGAEEYWQKYLDANPIFDPTNNKTPVLNEKRKPWREFFRQQGASPAPNNGSWSVREVR